MASNASTRESTAESTNEREIPVDTAEATPTPSRRAKRAASTRAKGAKATADGEDSKSEDTTRAAARGPFEPARLC